MNKFLKLFIIFTLITNCSFHKNSKFWSKKEIIVKQEVTNQKIFKKNDTIELEFNPNLKIKLSAKLINNSFLNNLNNNNGRINYNGNLQNVSKYKFSKIKNFYQYDPKIIFNKNKIIFFDNKGSILNFDNESNLIWKKNYYTKSEKKLNPILFFANNKNILIITDNISKLYGLDINTGKLLWSKKNSAPFNSQIKIYKNKFFAIDFKNVLRAYSIKDGKEIWNLKTHSALIRSQKKLSMVIIKEKIYFNNSLGDISSADIATGEMIWQTPTQSNLVYDEGYFLKTSDIIADNSSLYFSNNKNEFFSLDLKTGIKNWKQEVNSNLRPTLIDDYLFTVSKEGYLIIIEKKSGNIIRINYIFNTIKKNKRSIIEPTGFIVGKKNIYLTTSHGKLLEIDILSGKTKSLIKIDNKKISRPLVLNQDLYIITDNSIIRLN